MSRRKNSMKERKQDGMKMLLSALYEDLTGSQSQNPPSYRAAVAALFLPRIGEGTDSRMFAGFDADAFAWKSVWKGSHALLFGAFADTGLSTRANYLQTVSESLAPHLNGTILTNDTIARNSKNRLENEEGENGKKIERLRLVYAQACAKNFSRNMTLNAASLSDSTMVLLGAPTSRPHDVAMFVENTRVIVTYTESIGSEDGIVAFLHGRPSGDFYMYGIVFVSIVLTLLLVRERNKNKKSQEEMHVTSCLVERMFARLQAHEEAFRTLSSQSEAQEGMITNISARLDKAILTTDWRISDAQASVDSMETKADLRIGNLEASVDGLHLDLEASVDSMETRADVRIGNLETQLHLTLKKLHAEFDEQSVYTSKHDARTLARALRLQREEQPRPAS